MAISLFQILFDNPNATYTRGQQVTGNVLLELREEKRCRAIELRFIGEAKVHWTEGSGDDSQSYSDREVYLDKSVYLVGGPNTDITLTPGTYRYPFKLILPADIILPSSFEGTSGHLRYSAKASICRPWKFDNTCKAAFTVLDPLDLNKEPALLEPVQSITEKNLCCGCWGGPPISLSVSLSFAGYVPGQTIHAVLKLDNPANNDITLKACLIQEITYKAQGSKHVTKKNVCKENISFVRPRQSMTSSVYLTVPPLPNSYLRDCRCIDISYIFEIKGSIAGPHRDIHAGVSVVIGSIPLRTQFAAIAPWDSQHPSAPVENCTDISQAGELVEQGSTSRISAPPDPFLIYSDMPPPSYQDYLQGKTNIHDKEDDEFVQAMKEFAPRYPVYNFKQSGV